MSDQTEQGGTVGVAEGPVFSKHARSGEGNGDGGVPLAADKAPENVAFLLSQVGAYAGARFAARLAEIDLQPSLFRVLNLVDAAEGRSQQEIAKAVQAPPSRMVGFVDELERRGLVERRAKPKDRRVRALFLTEAGREALARGREVAHSHSDELVRGLSEPEREQLIGLLRKVVDVQSIGRGVHPGFSGKLGPG